MSDKANFDEEMDRLQGHMPDWAGRNFDRLRQPEAVWVRVPAGIALTGGGMLGFLPVLGVWMLPLGLALLAEDVPALRSARSKVFDWIERRKPQWFEPSAPKIDQS